MRGSLPENSEGKRMSLKQPGISSCSLIDVANKLGAKEVWSRFHRLECPHAPEHFAAIVPCHPGWSDRRRTLVRVEIRRMGHCDTAISEVDRALRVLGKLRQELFSEWNHLVGLSARLGYDPAQRDILTFAKRAAEGVARKRSGRALVPCHDHARVQPAGQRHSDRLPTAEVPRKVLRKDLTELEIIRFRLKRRLVLPLLLPKICYSLLDPTVPRKPKPNSAEAHARP